MTEQNELELDINDLTLGDMEYLEDEFGSDWNKKLQADPPAKLMIALTWRLMLAKNPSATLDDARKVKVMGAFGALSSAEDQPREDETPPIADGA